MMGGGCWRGGLYRSCGWRLQRLRGPGLDGACSAGAPTAVEAAAAAGPAAACLAAAPAAPATSWPSCRGGAGAGAGGRGGTAGGGSGGGSARGGGPGKFKLRTSTLSVPSQLTGTPSPQSPKPTRLRPAAAHACSKCALDQSSRPSRPNKTSPPNIPRPPPSPRIPPQRRIIVTADPPAKEDPDKSCARGRKVPWVVGADWLGSFFVLVASKMPGPNHKARVAQLWGRVQEYYERRGIQDRLQNLTPSMLHAQGKWPKLRCSAAQCRALVDFGMEISRLLDAGSPAEEAASVGMKHLHTCYQCLSEEVIFSKELLTDSSFKFAQQYVALEDRNGRAWRVKPKLHLFLELCIEGGKPATCWTYRDEDWGGSVAKMARRRGGLLSTAAFSSNVLNRFRMQQPVIRMR